MKPKTRDWLTIGGEAGLFSIVLLVLWLDEFIDLPHLLWGAPPTPCRLQEYILETLSILVTALIVITTTLVIQYRARRVEEFLKVCAWCRRVLVDDKWVSFEKYIEKSQSLRSSHGICEECLAKQKMKSGKMLTNIQSNE
ncbi:MAG TPA: hypothetical protein PLR71_03995 [Deltaproteobacteria bacterium]|nr:hypothetical protein [Deltaproteobacteria bacterium]HQI80702.1 hypothetical protein [Deltaproteobacteria bacterium]